MSHPVDLKIRVTDLVLFENVCEQQKISSERVTENNVVVGLDFNMGGIYGKGSLRYTKETKSFKLKVDSMKEAKLLDSVVKTYNALFASRTLEDAGYTVTNQYSANNDSIMIEAEI